MPTRYEYDPNDYKDILNVYEDMVNFYKLLEKYNKRHSMHNRLFLGKQLNDLLFTLKHRELEGSLTHATAAEMREYMRGLIDDQLQ